MADKNLLREEKLPKHRLRRADHYRRVRAYERQAKESPSIYRMKIRAMAWAGYLFIFGVTLIVMAALAAVAWQHYHSGFQTWHGFAYGFLGVTLLSLVRGCLVRIGHPSGIEFQRGHLPRIEQKINHVRAKLKIRTRPRIIISDEFNAGAASRPLFGIAGPSRHYLILGLPLMAGIPDDDLTAVIAHEMAHLSKYHSRFLSRVVRLITLWNDLLVRMERTLVGRFVLVPFARRYAADFEARSLVLMRQHEIEANQLAARVAGVRAVAAVLVRMELRTQMVVTPYFDELWRNALTQPEPQRDAISRLILRLGNPLDRDRGLHVLRRTLGNETHIQDTHPALSETLAALNVKLYGTEESKAEELWANAEGQLKGKSIDACVPVSTRTDAVKLFDALFAASVEPLWKIRLAQGEKFRLMASEIDQQWWATEKITIRKLWRRAWLAGELSGPDSSIPLIQQLLKLDPDHASANFQLGVWLQDKNDSEDGPRHIEAAIKSNPALQPDGQTILADYHRRTGDSERAEEIRMASFKAADAWDLAIEERQITRASDTFLPHNLPPDAVSDLIELYSGLDGISEIYLVQKEVSHFSTVPFHVIAMKPRIHPFKSWMKQREDLAFELAMRDDLPESHVIVLLDRGKWWLRRAVSRIAGSSIWRRKRKWWQLS